MDQIIFKIRKGSTTTREEKASSFYQGLDSYLLNIKNPDKQKKNLEPYLKDIEPVICNCGSNEWVQVTNINASFKKATCNKCKTRIGFSVKNQQLISEYI
jgi:hypothetical protein